MKRHRSLRPLSREHHQALLVAFKVKRSLSGLAESAGAPADVKGLVKLVERYDEEVLKPHTRAEEELLGSHLAEKDLLRLRKEHEELRRLVSLAKRASGQQCRQELGSFADLLERHVRWEERELFPYAEDHLDAATLADIGGQIEERLVR